MRSVYSVRGFTAATGTTEPQPVCQLWNPDSAIRVRVLECGVTLGGVLPNVNQTQPLLVRTTTRGTPGSTVTPDADNAWDNLVAPLSGVLLDLAQWSVNPTEATPGLLGWNLGGSVSTGTAGMGWVWANPVGIDIPPGTGLLISPTIGGAAAWPTSEVYFVWEEGP